MEFLKIKMIVFWEMLMDAAIVNNLFKENFDEKKKKTMNVFIVFFIFYKSGAKNFPKIDC